jgi:hypothetical protein
MARLLATVGAVTGLGLLLASGVSHGGRAAAFRYALARQAMWPRVLVAPVAATVTLIELVVGVIGLLAVGLPAVDGFPASLRLPALSAAAVVYVAFAVYSVALLRRRPDAPCGCSAATDDRVNAWVTVRACALAAGCWWAAANAQQLLPWSPTAEALMALLASGAFVALAWTVPAALHNPDRDLDAPAAAGAGPTRLSARPTTSTSQGLTAGRLEAVGSDRNREG